MQRVAKQSATWTRLQLLVLAIAAVSTTSCSCGGKTALGAHARDAQADLLADMARGDGSALEIGTDVSAVSGTGGAAVGGNGGSPTGGSSGAMNGGGGSGGHANGGAAGGLAAGGSAGTVAAGGVVDAAAGDAGGMGGILATGGRTGVGGSGGRSASGGSAGQVATGGVADAGAGGTGGKTTGPDVDGAAADGPPHWRESAGSLCTGLQKYASIAASVWSDDRGVFAIIPDGDNPVSIWANSGTGWRTYFSWPKGKWNSTGGIRGIVDGPLVAFSQSTCGIQLVDDAGAHCSGAAPALALSVVGANLAYAAYYDILLKFDGELWTQLGAPLPYNGKFNAKDLWANASTIVVAGSNGQIAVLEDEQTPAPLPEPTAANILATWAFGANDIWIGTEGSELYHYDGSQWSFKASLPPGRGVTFVRLWGKDGHLFVASNQLFAEWDGSQLRNLLPADAGSVSFTDVWGNSPTEVFATGVGSDTETSGCSAFQVWWYDGTVARPM